MVAILLVVASSHAATAAVPSKTLFEGVLTSVGGGPVADGPGDVDAKALEKTWDSKTLPKVGDPTAWFGKNAKGLWTLKVLDASFCIPQKPGNASLCDINNKADGAVADWSVQIETLSNKKLHDPNGHLYARITSAKSDALEDGKSLLIDTKAADASLVAQAWVYDKEKKNWLPARTGVDSVGSCTSCGSGKYGDYLATSNKNLSGGTYEFKSFTIQKGVTVRATGSTPLIIKVQGAVQNDGILDLNGNQGQDISSCCGSTSGGSGGGGGSGGAIWLRGGKISLLGTVQAKGGIGGKSDKVNGYGGDGGNGSDGRIRIDSPGTPTGTTTPNFAKGDATDLGTLLNRFVLEQNVPGQVKLTNTSGQTHAVRLVVTY